MVKHFLLFVFLALISLVHIQAQSGFISIDCGIADNSSYIDSITGITYVSDVGYIDTGESKSIASTYKTDTLVRQFANVRSFPQGLKNCYTLTPPQYTGSSRYFLRARFMYGNYDGKNRNPNFDLYLGVNYWATVKIVDASTSLDVEILHVPSSNYTYVCLVNKGTGTPFISALELRLVADGIYNSVSGSLALYGRYDLRSWADTSIIRYQDDIYDRIWKPPFFTAQDGVSVLSTTLTITANIFEIPYVVMANSITPTNASVPLDFYWIPDDPTIGYYVYMHFSDFQNNFTREFDIKFNDQIWFPKSQPLYLGTNTIHSVDAQTPATRVNFSLVRTANSKLPPILNALELYTVKDLPDPQTDEGDVDAMKNIKAAYGVSKNWQGDPCLPNAYLWEGLKCLNITFQSPRIISLNLSLSGLSGIISNSILKLNLLQTLDLSNNSLTGDIPGFLSQMEKLTVLILSGNNFTGTVPAALIAKQKSGSLSLSIDGNPNLCTSQPCNKNSSDTQKPPPPSPPPTQVGKKSSMLVPIIASVAAVLALLVAFSIWFICCHCKKKSKQPAPPQGTDREINTFAGPASEREAPFKAKQQKFTYSEVLMITRNFKRVLGQGGFGTVYHGYLDGTEVAVKMLSETSAQGYKEFKGEAEILMKVHHRNLTTLVGYCDEGDKLGLIYEFMANGDLESHLSDRSTKFLSWDLRLQIAVDAAQGLEYLHTGCTAPIIHRDVKSTNILLSSEYQGKLADFGLSKDFPTDGSTQVATGFAGTPGYIDPEYNINEKSDIYSFGVVLLEIITGKPPLSRNQERGHLSQWVSRTLAARGDVRDIVDPRIGKSYDGNSLWKIVDIATECVSISSAKRPTMNQVVIELKGCLEMEKDRLRKSYDVESNYDSIPMSTPNIPITGLNPLPR